MRFLLFLTNRAPQGLGSACRSSFAARKEATRPRSGCQLALGSSLVLLFRAYEGKMMRCFKYEIIRQLMIFLQKILTGCEHIITFDENIVGMVF